MKMTKIKICGMMRRADINAVNIAHPDYIGFIFAKGRKRTISAETAAQLKERLMSDIKAVGVFLDNDIKEIAKICEDGIINIVQLHGNEDKDFISSLKRRISCPIIKAVSVCTPEDILLAQTLPADYLLLDTYKKGQSGGTGEAFDWSLIPEMEKPFFLAGGLNEENIGEAMKCGAYALDVSSGAETDGKKDIHKIINIVRKVRGD